MQPNIAMKFAERVAWILLCRHSKFGEKFFYSSRDIANFSKGVTFFSARLVNRASDRTTSSQKSV